MCPVIFVRSDNYRSPRNNNEPVPPCRAPPSAIFYFCPGNTDARLIFFNHGRAASRAVYRGFLTREIHRNRSLSLLARCARASERTCAPELALVCAPAISPAPGVQPPRTVTASSEPFTRSLDLSFTGSFRTPVTGLTALCCAMSTLRSLSRN